MERKTGYLLAALGLLIAFITGGVSFTAVPTIASAVKKTLLVAFFTVPILSLCLLFYTITGYQDGSQSLLHKAAGSGHICMMRLLLVIGADVNSTDKAGETPLHVAVKAGEVNAVRLLLDRGAGVNARAIDRQTPLDMCFVGRSQYPEVGKSIEDLLREHGGKTGAELRAEAFELEPRIKELRVELKIQEESFVAQLRKEKASAEAALSQARLAIAVERDKRATTEATMAALKASVDDFADDLMQERQRDDRRWAEKMKVEVARARLGAETEALASRLAEEKDRRVVAESSVISNQESVRVANAKAYLAVRLLTQAQSVDISVQQQVSCVSSAQPRKVYTEDNWRFPSTPHHWLAGSRERVRVLCQR